MREPLPAGAFRVRVPASSANLGPGFDSFGLALGLYHDLRVAPVGDGCSQRPRIELQLAGEGCDRLPAGEANLVVATLRAGLAQGGYAGADLVLHGRSAIPLASGLGSSAAAWLAGAAAAQWLCRGRLDLEALLTGGSQLEGHADNVAPCVFGGFTIVYRHGTCGLRHARFDLPDGLEAAVVVPCFPLTTRASRQVLPDSVSRDAAVHAVAHAALVAAALAAGRQALLRDALVDEVLHEPHRAHLVPGLAAVRAAALEAGALGAVLSGSGPSILALADSGTGAPVADAMARAWSAAGVKCRRFTPVLDARGLEILSDTDGVEECE